MSKNILTKYVDLLVIGGGPAGLASAIKAKEEGIKNILLIDRNESLGGILPQCIHDGFGLEILKKSLTGPEYAYVYTQKLKKYNINHWLNSMVISLNNKKEALIANEDGLVLVKAKAVILSCGCREKSRGNLKIAGTRPAGIFTAGTAQYLINIKNYMPGKSFVILGSGDIGLIMARRLTLEGAKVNAVIETLPYPSGLPRNVEQCLNDFNIPILFNQTITRINGKKRIESVTTSKKEIPCDSLLLSCGLIPENEISKEAGILIDPNTLGPYVDENYMTNIAGIFSCGNSLHVHDIADFATLEAELTAKKSAGYINNKYRRNKSFIKMAPGQNIKYIIPQFISTKEDVEFSLRVLKPENNQYLSLFDGIREIKKIKFFNRINPPEMIKIKIEKGNLINLKNIKLEFTK